MGCDRGHFCGAPRVTTMNVPWGEGVKEGVATYVPEFPEIHGSHSFQDANLRDHYLQNLNDPPKSARHNQHISLVNYWSRHYLSD
jgi:hypothetical protein